MQFQWQYDISQYIGFNLVWSKKNYFHSRVFRANVFFFREIVWLFFKTKKKNVSIPQLCILATDDEDYEIVPPTNGTIPKRSGPKVPSALRTFRIVPDVTRLPPRGYLSVKTILSISLTTDGFLTTRKRCYWETTLRNSVLATLYGIARERKIKKKIDR